MSQLVIEHHGDGTFHVVRSAPDYKSVPAGGAIQPPNDFDVSGMLGAKLSNELRWLLEKFLDYPFEPRTHQADRATAALQAWGEAAFNALFHSGPARDFYQAAIAPGIDQLRFVVSSDDPQVLSWPWEALYDPAHRFIAQHCDIERKLTKDIADPPPVPASLPKDRVNILLVTCRPDGEQDVGYRSISRSLVDLVHASDLPAEVTVLRPPTFEQLERELSERPGYFHVLHFDGHGAYGALAPSGGPPQASPLSAHTFKGPQGFLVFEKTDGSADLVASSKLDQLLLTHKIPAVVLNACQSAMVDDNAESAFASVAASLMHAGVRSVVAMAYSLYVTGAQRFLPAFYETLFRTGSFASATRGGRRAMLADKGRVCAVGTCPLDDWLVPVLYQQQPFEFSFAKPGASKPTTLEPRPSRLPPEARLDQVEYGFVGRDSAILALERGLLAPAPVLLVHGLGGAGKTTLARGFADWLDKTNGLEACLWFAFDDIHSAEFVIDTIAARFFPPEFKTQATDAKLELLSHALNQHRVLLIWDNFETASGNVDAGVSPLLKTEDLDLLKRLLTQLRGGKGKVILTSRSEEDTWLPQSLRRKIELGGLWGEERWEFCDLITRTLGLKIDRKDKDLIALLDLLEGHPLLMRAVLPELERTSAAAVAQAILANGVTLDNRTAATLKFVEDRLPADLKPLLVPLALHERFIDANSLEAMAKQMAEPKIDRGQIDRFCRALAIAGLLHDRGQAIYQLHPALTRHIRASVPVTAPDPSLLDWRRSFVAVMASIADHYAPKQLHDQRTIFFLHEANFRAALDLAATEKMETAVAALLQSLAAYAQNTRRWVDAEALFQRLAEQRTTVNDESGTAKAYHQLGRIAEERRDFDQAEKWYLKSLAIKEKLGNEYGAAQTFGAIGLMHAGRGDPVEGVRWLVKAARGFIKARNPRAAEQTRQLAGEIATDPAHRTLWPADELGPLPEPKKQ
jgi:tetratricopeptide (TPR) repeat protein